MAFITKVKKEGDCIIGYYGCQVVWKIPATAEKLKYYGLEVD